MSSSIHLQTASHGSVTHNARENFSHSVVFTDEKNELQNNTKQAYEIYRKELAIRSKAYSDRTRQKLQKKTSTKLSAVVNLKRNHTLKDLEPIKNYLEKKLDTKVYQMAIHRDEGKLVSKKDGTELYSGKNFFKNIENDKLYYDKKYTKEIDLDEYEIVKNYHAHIEMLGIDSTGAAIRHNKMHKHFLKKLQDFTAQTLGMERTYGNKKRLDTHQFKQVGTEKQVTKKILKEEIKKLRAELSGQGLAKEDFARVNELNRELKERIKDKDLTINDLQKKLKTLSDLTTQTINKHKEAHEKTQKELSEAQKTILKHEATISSQKELIEQLRANISELEYKIKQLESELKIHRGKDRQIKRKEVNKAKQLLKSKEAELSYLIPDERSEININEVEQFIKASTGKDQRKARRYLECRKEYEKFKAHPEWCEIEDINLEDLKQDLDEAEKELLSTKFKPEIITEKMSYKEMAKIANAEAEKQEDLGLSR